MTVPSRGVRQDAVLCHRERSVAISVVDLVWQVLVEAGLLNVINLNPPINKPAFRLEGCVLGLNAPPQSSALKVAINFPLTHTCTATHAVRCKWSPPRRRDLLYGYGYSV